MSVVLYKDKVRKFLNEFCVEMSGDLFTDDDKIPKVTLLCFIDAVFKHSDVEPPIFNVDIFYGDVERKTKSFKTVFEMSLDLCIKEDKHINRRLLRQLMERVK